MELAYKTAALCLIAALTAVFLRRGTPELGLVLSLATAAVVLLAILSPLEEALTLLDGLLERTGLERALFLPLLRIVGISLVARLGADLCRDAGQGTLASLVELSAALCSLLAAAPLLTTAAKLFGGWMIS